MEYRQPLRLYRFSAPSREYFLSPLEAAGITSVFTCLTVILPVILGLLSVPVVVYCFIAWKRRWWRLPGRIHYSLYTLAAAGMTWFFWYYNSLGF